jgi:hypothetical protein
MDISRRILSGCYSINLLQNVNFLFRLYYHDLKENTQSFVRCLEWDYRWVLH